MKELNKQDKDRVKKELNILLKRKMDYSFYMRKFDFNGCKVNEEGVIIIRDNITFEVVMNETIVKEVDGYAKITHEKRVAKIEFNGRDFESDDEVILWQFKHHV